MKTNKKFDDYWLEYLRAHSKLQTRIAHYVGITLVHAGATALLLLGSPWLGILWIVFGFLVAWASHPLIEGNKPMMWSSPARSVVCGQRLYWLGITGRLGPHLERAGV